jgi:hypothetical protein
MGYGKNVPHRLRSTIKKKFRFQGYYVLKFFTVVVTAIIQFLVYCAGSCVYCLDDESGRHMFMV